MKKIRIITAFIAGILLLWGSIVFAQTVEEEYNAAVKLVKENKNDFAFMAFRSIARRFPENDRAGDCLFAIGEYYYGLGSYHDAIESFAQYINDYPVSKGAVFARAYLLKIMQGMERPSQEQKERIESIKSNFFSKPLFLLFSEFKEASYRSAFANEFTIRYYVDIIEIHCNGKIFLKITE